MTDTGPEVLATSEEFYAAAKKAFDEGWSHYAYEDAIDGALVLFLWHEGLGRGHDERRLIWRPFGTLTSDYTFVGREAAGTLPGILAAFPRERTVRWDDPKSRNLGFVHFEKPGCAIGLRFGLTTLKSTEPFEVHGQSFMSWRDALPTLAEIANAPEGVMRLFADTHLPGV